MTDEAWIDTVRLVRDTGTVRELFPEGVDDVRDLPHTLFDAIQRASVFIAWEQLAEEEQPPRRIWLDGEALTEWFNEVKRKRRSEADPNHQVIEDPVENDAAKSLFGG